MSYAIHIAYTLRTIKMELLGPRQSPSIRRRLVARRGARGDPSSTVLLGCYLSYHTYKPTYREKGSRHRDGGHPAVWAISPSSTDTARPPSPASLSVPCLPHHRPHRLPPSSLPRPPPPPSEIPSFPNVAERGVVAPRPSNNGVTFPSDWQSSSHRARRAR